MHGGGVLLLSAVAGYWVLERSSGHKGTLKQVGQVLGWVVIVVSLVGLACRVSCAVTGKGRCSMPDKGGHLCPFTGNPIDAPATK